MARTRKVKTGGIRKLKSGRFEVRVRSKLFDGRVVTRDRVVVDTHHEAEAALIQLRARAAQRKLGLLREVSKVTFGEVGERLRAQAKRNGKPWSSSRASMWRRLKPFWMIPSAALVDADVTGFMERLRPLKGAEPIADTYRRGLWELVVRVQSAAVAMGEIERSRLSTRPMGVPPPTRVENRRDSFSGDQLASLLDAARTLSQVPRGRSPDLYLRLRLWAQTGVRPIELASLRREWVVPASTLHRHAPEGCDAIQWPSAKKGKRHVSTLDLETSTLLRLWLDAMEPAAAACGFVFPVRVRGKWGRRAQFICYPQSVKLRKLAGLSAMVLYQIRHTHISAVTNKFGPALAVTSTGIGMRIAVTYQDNQSPLTVPGMFDPKVSMVTPRPEPPEPDDTPDDTPDGTGGGANKKRPRGKSVSRDNARKAARAAAYKAFVGGHGGGTVGLLDAEPPPHAPHPPVGTHAPGTPTEPDVYLSKLRAISARVQAEGAAPLAAVLVATVGAEDALLEMLDARAALPADEGLRALSAAVVARVSEVQRPIPSIALKPPVFGAFRAGLRVVGDCVTRSDHHDDQAPQVPKNRSETR